MKKRIKLLFTILSICIAFSSLMLGVFALTQETYTVKGSMSYSMEYGLIDIQTSVYKYMGEPLTKEDGLEYLDDLASLEPLPEYDKSFCTYDENFLLKDTINNQIQQNLDFKYKDGQAFYVIIHATSQTKDKAIKVTVNTTFNVENSWFYTSGSTYLFKNKTGKDIVFAWGIESAMYAGNGDFNFEITFEEDTDYAPEDTASIGLSILDASSYSESYVENIFVQLDEFNEAEYLEERLWFEVPSSKMISMEEDYYNSYAPLINFNVGGYTVKTLVSYSFGGVTMYDQNGKIIPLDDNLIFAYVPDKNFTDMLQVQEYMASYGTPSFDDTAPGETRELEPGEEIVGCVLIGVIVDKDSAQQLDKITFSVKITVQEIAPTIKVKLPYTHRYQPMVTGSEEDLIAYITPGSNTKKQQSQFTIDDKTITMLEVEDRVEEVQIKMSEIEPYIESSGYYEISSCKGNMEIYANPLVYMQAVALTMMTGSSGFLPIVKQPVTIEGYLFKPENWLSDIAIWLPTYIGMNETEQEYYEQYFTAMPEGENDIISVPMHLYKVENVLWFITALCVYAMEEEGKDCVQLEWLMNMYYGMYQIAVQKGTVSGGNLTYKEFIVGLVGGTLDDSFMGGTENSDLLTYATTWAWTPFVDGDEFPVDVMNISGYGSKYYTYDVLNYESQHLYNMSELDCKSYASKQAYFLEVDDCGYIADMSMFVRYPNLKTGQKYEVIDGVGTIADWAFRNAKHLKEVTFPASVDEVDNYIFENSSVEIWNVWVSTVIAQKEQIISNIVNSNITTLNIYSEGSVDQSLIDSILIGAMGVDVNVLYLDNVSGLSFQQGADGLFVSGISNTGLTKVVIPEYVTVAGTNVNVVGINDGVFANCTSLTEIGFPRTLTVIGDNNFGNCSSLTKLYLTSQTIAEFGTGNVHSNMQIFTKDEGSYNQIRTVYPNSIGVDMQISFAGGRCDFDFAFTLGTKSYRINGTTRQMSIPMYNLKMFVFPDSSVNASLTTSYSGILEQGNMSNGVQVQISLAKKESGDTYTQLMGTGTGATNYNTYSGSSATTSYPTSGTVSVSRNSDLRLVINHTMMQQVSCFTEDTLVTMADGTYRTIQKIGYDDLLMVYNFDIGKFEASYPSWISQTGDYDNYYLVEFDDGSSLQIVLNHRLFSTSDMQYILIIDADYSCIGKKFLRQVMQDGVPVLTEVTCTNITKIYEKCKFYNMVTSQAINFMSNGYIGGTSNVNIYQFEKVDDQTYIHNQDQMAECAKGDTSLENGTIFGYDRFDAEKVPYYVYVAYRLAELRNMVKILAQLPPYNTYPIQFVEQRVIEEINAYFGEKYTSTMVEMPDTFKMTLSDREQTVRYSAGDKFTLPQPYNTENFVGWYSSFDGKIYQPGDQSAVYMNTHFIARYAA